MKRNSKKRTSAEEVDQHIEAVGPMLTRLRKQLTGSDEKKGTYADYLRLLEFYREAFADLPRDIYIGWVDPAIPGDELRIGPPEAA